MRVPPPRVPLAAVFSLALASAACGPGADEAPARRRAGLDAAAATFLVGFARQDVSTTRVVPMGGYGVYFGLPSATRSNGVGTHDPLYASAAAVRAPGGRGFVLVAIDAVGLSSPSVGRIREGVRARLGSLEGLEVVVAATHDHHSPDTMGLWGALPYFTGRDKAYMQALEARAAQAAADAVAASVPATLAVGRASKPNTSSGEADPARRDDEVVALVARDAASGAVLGTLTQWAAHPTVLGAENNALSSDFVGPFRHYMAERFGGVPVYVNGALGNLYAEGGDAPAPDPFSGARDPDVGGGYEEMAGIGRDLFARAEAALASATPLGDGAVDARSVRVTVPVDNALFRLAADGFLGGPPLIETPYDDGRVETELTWLRVGELQAATVPGEIFAGGARRLRDLLAAEGASQGLLIGLGQDWLGYLMAPDEYDDPDLAYNRGLSPSREAQSVVLDAYQAFFAAN